MRADNSAHVITAAKQRHEFTRSKAIRAIGELVRTGVPVTFQAVATRAEVSRSWLYSQPDIKTEICKLRALDTGLRSASIPARQRGSDASLRRRLEIANQRIRGLTADNERLRRQLEEALGRNRTDRPNIAL